MVYPHHATIELCTEACEASSYEPQAARQAGVLAVGASAAAPRPDEGVGAGGLAASPLPQTRPGKSGGA